jgi:hypothetical protein
MNIKIQSDGTAHNTKVVTEKGEPLHVKAISFNLHVGEVSDVTLELDMVQFDFHGPAHYEIIHPLTGKPVRFKQIELEDGSFIQSI